MGTGYRTAPGLLGCVSVYVCVCVCVFCGPCDAPLSLSLPCLSPASVSAVRELLSQAPGPRPLLSGPGRARLPLLLLLPSSSPLLLLLLFLLLLHHRHFFLFLLCPETPSVRARQPAHVYVRDRLRSEALPPPGGNPLPRGPPPHPAALPSSCK